MESRVLGAFFFLAAALSWSCGPPDDPPPVCEASGCAGLGFECGMHEECGRSIDCGICAEGSSCVEGLCTPCVPSSCADLGVECQTAHDGCGGSLDCGTCEHGFDCEAGLCVRSEDDVSFCDALPIPDDGVTIIGVSDDLAAAIRNAPAGQTLLLEAGT